MVSWLIFAVIVALAGASIILTARLLSRRRRHGRGLILGSLVILTAVAGLGLTVLPVTASTGADCQLSPVTSVISSGQEGMTADNETDRQSVQSCQDRGRAQTVGAIAASLIAGIGYLTLRRSTLTRPALSH